MEKVENKIYSATKRLRKKKTNFDCEAADMDRLLKSLPGSLAQHDITNEQLDRIFGKLLHKCQEIKQIVFRQLSLFLTDSNRLGGMKASLPTNKISMANPLDIYVATSKYKKQENGEISLQVGMLVDVVEKTDTGWWFVNSEDDQGWVPGVFLQREDGVKDDMKIKLPPGKEEQYLCTTEFKAKMDCELSMERGAIVDVIEKSLDGWWLARYKSQEGYVPATYLIKAENLKVKRHSKQNKQNCKRSLSPTGAQIVKNLSEISDLFQNSSLEGNKSTNSNYVTVAAFSDAVDSGISFETGQTVQVLEKSKTGWWYIMIDDREGWAPASYIQAADTVYSTVNKRALSSVKTSEIDRNSDSAQELMGAVTKPKPIQMEKSNVTDKPNATEKPNLTEKNNVKEKFNVQKKPIVTEKIKGNIKEFTKLESSCAPVKNKKDIMDGLSEAKSTGQSAQPQPPPAPDKIIDTTINQVPCFKTTVIANQKPKPQIPAKPSTININSKLEKNKMPEDKVQNANNTVSKAPKSTKPNNIDVKPKSEKNTLLQDKIASVTITRNLKNMLEMKNHEHGGGKKQFSYPALPPKPKNILDTNMSSAEGKQINKFPMSSPWVKQMGDCKMLTALESTFCENSASGSQ